jgi:hypothetical protein
MGGKRMGEEGTDAVKFALPVTALEVSAESFELYITPLWPRMWCVCVRERERQRCRTSRRLNLSALVYHLGSWR